MFLLLCFNYIFIKYVQVDPVEGLVKWDHFKILHNYDKMITNTKLRLCPKLTDNHLDLRNSSLKMRVRLAVQVNSHFNLFIF